MDTAWLREIIEHTLVNVTLMKWQQNGLRLCGDKPFFSPLALAAIEPALTRDMKLPTRGSSGLIMIDKDVEMEDDCEGDGSCV